MKYYIVIVLLFVFSPAISQSAALVKDSTTIEKNAKIAQDPGSEYEKDYLESRPVLKDNDEMPDIYSPSKLWSPTEKEILFSGLERTGNELIQEIIDLSEQQWDFKEDTERWSIAEIVEHLFAQNESYRIEIRTALDQPELPQFVEKAKGNDAVFINYVNDPLKADAGNQSPIGRFCNKEKSMFAFNRNCNQLISLVKTTDKDMRKHFIFRDWVFDGQLSNVEKYLVRDIHQMLLTCIAHTDRHLNQIRKVKDHPNFPL